MLATFIWDPSRVFFKIPLIGYPVTWYGCFFALGFMVGYGVMRHLLTAVFSAAGREKEGAKSYATELLDRFSLLAAFFAVIGARLGYVFFYGWPYYRENPSDIWKVWEGGLASHGAAIGLFCALFYFVKRWKKRYPELSLLFLLDALVIAAPFAAGAIRLGNFMNQEITGIPTRLPWGVIFMHPMDNAAGIPLHPVQLYEAFYYFSLFALLYAVWQWRGKELGKGVIAGVFFIALFLFRFAVEFLKIPQGEVLSADAPLRMGQLLSLPFIGLGIYLLIRARRVHAQKG